MRCIVCRNEVSKALDVATEYTIWELPDLGKLREESTGRVAHIVCLNGEQHDERQMTITDVINKEE